jgi:hypothetical protein
MKTIKTLKSCGLLVGLCHLSPPSNLAIHLCLHHHLYLHNPEVPVHLFHLEEIDGKFKYGEPILHDKKSPFIAAGENPGIPIGPYQETKTKAFHIF